MMLKAGTRPQPAGLTAALLRAAVVLVDDLTVAAHTRIVELHDGTKIRIRPVLPSDRERIAQGFYRLSPDSRYRRFMSPLQELTPEMLSTLTELDYVDHFALGAETLDDEPDGIGVARYVRTEDDAEVAEAAVAVVDDWQGRGVGTALVAALGEEAATHGIKRFVAYVLAENRQAIEMLEAMEATIARDGAGTLRCYIELPQRPVRLQDTQMYRVLRAVARGELPILGPLQALLQRIQDRATARVSPPDES